MKIILFVYLLLLIGAITCKKNENKLERDYEEFPTTTTTENPYRKMWEKLIKDNVVIAIP